MEDTALAALLDADQRIVDANAAFLEVLGPAPGAVIGARFTAFLAPELRERPRPGDALSDWYGRRADGLPWCATLATFQAADGTTAVLHGTRRYGPVRWAPSGGGTGGADEPPRSAGIDAVISHDIRGALRGASGFVSVVKRAADDPEIARLHERLAKAGEHLQIAARSLATADEIAEKVVDYLRWGARPFTMQAVPLGSVVEQAVALSDETFTGPTAAVEVGVLPDVIADVEHMRWVIAEVLTNARKFSADSPAVSIELADDDDGFCDVRVRDNGIGIDPLLVDDAFLPGRKLQARGDYAGVGMGLTLCRLVCERHAGNCWVEPGDASAPGTTVRLRLPIA